MKENTWFFLLKVHMIVKTMKSRKIDEIHCLSYRSLLSGRLENIILPKLRLIVKYACSIIKLSTIMLTL